ncbi:hypothetical protein TrLO_g13859 [Triparma laevis f. longispina]|uniref:Uncharacterized protein n=1 Tax=Triparma laevis f. longispina TaxID=1714387 RepID=A0A9W7EAF7_9STRA|nr:hypothetical protein TrLO_g13859 [Triparma laevis f. longispina]
MPDFYGYVPDSPRIRAAMFMSLMGFSSVKILLTALLVVCLGYINVIYVVYLIGGDMMFYLVLKAVRGDFRYWLPIDGLTGLTLSLDRHPGWTGSSRIRLAWSTGLYARRVFISNSV